MDYHSLLKQERNRLSKKIALYQHAIESLPEGTLISNKNGDYNKYYVFKDGVRSYLSADNQQIIKDLAKKKYLLTELEDYHAEIRAIDRYLKNHRTDSLVQKLLEKDDGVAAILQQILVPDDDRYRRWAQEDYPKYQGFPQDLIHRGPFGKMYRSKTEANIAYLLMKNQIPQRYEWEQDINGTTYPIDFTTLHPKSGKYIYWEHFGKMDDWKYCMKIGPKLYDFANAGIIADLNLILTFETKQYPMEITQLEEIISRWYL